MKNSITYRKLILLFSTVIIPCFLLSFFLIYQNNNNIHTRTFRSVQEKTDLTAQTLSDTIEQIYNTTTEFSNQRNIQRIAKTSFLLTPYEKAQWILQIQEQQTSIKNANQYIENLIIYYEETGKAYNSTGSGYPSFFTFSPDEYEELCNLPAPYTFLAVTDQKLSLLFQPSPFSGFLMRINLSSSAIAELLENTHTNYDPYYLLEGFDNSWKITNLTDEQLSCISEDISSDNASSDKLLINNTDYYCFSSSLPYGEMRIRFFFSENSLFADTQIPSYFVYFSLLILIVCCLFLWGSYTIIHKPIQTLINAFQHISKQNYDVRIFNKTSSDFSYLYQEFNQMTEQLGTLIEKDYQQQLLLNKAELKQLQAQINPHFLYNSLFLLRNMIYDELYPEALNMSDTLGQYFQYITRNSQDYVPLGREYNHAILYCEIQKLRFEGRIHIETDVLPAEYTNILVPKLIIQPLLENSFNYGLQNTVTNGLLKVTVTTDTSGLIISVEDNGENLSDSKLQEIQNNLQSINTKSTLQEATGILNIQRRLTIYSDGSSSLKATRSILGGLCIQIFLSTSHNE